MIEFQAKRQDYFGALNISNKAGIFAKIVSIQKLVQPNGSIS